jgi:hypothetical protein
MTRRIACEEEIRAVRRAEARWLLPPGLKFLIPVQEWEKKWELDAESEPEAGQ